MCDPASLIPESEVPSGTVIAIDGPSGSGKSTTARALAERFGLIYVDTGAMYRALTRAALDAGIDTGDSGSLTALLREADLRLRTTKRETEVFWNGHDISAAIRTPEVESNVSAVSAHHAVRGLMVERQREYGRSCGVVMEGRDIGSVVFPLATVKIYLDASIEARVERRWHQHRRRGADIDRAEVAREIRTRDEFDSNREESPLTVSPDAIVVDNSMLSFREQLEATSAAARRVIAEQQPMPRPAVPVPFKYRLAFACFGTVARILGLRVIGSENIWQREGVIYASNHVSMWDPPMIGAALTGRTPIHALAKQELMVNPLVGAVYRFLDVIPIRRTINDVAAFSAATAKLAGGGNVLIFPEGTRRPHGEPGPVRGGLGRLMQQSGAPAVPMFVRGTCDVKPGGSGRSPLEIRVAPPVRLRALPVLSRDHDDREISRRVGKLFVGIYNEMLALSATEKPLSDWELELTERQRFDANRRSARLRDRRQAEKSGRKG